MSTSTLEKHSAETSMISALLDIKLQVKTYPLASITVAGGPHSQVKETNMASLLTCEELVRITGSGGHLWQEMDQSYLITSGQT